MRMSDDPKKEPNQSPDRIVLSGAGAVAAAGQLGMTHAITLSGVGAFSAAGEIGTRVEIVKTVADLLLQTVIVPGERTDDGKLIEAVAVPWFEIIALLEKDPGIAFEISWEK